ncbi:MAG: ComF family protein [Candidatus Hydrogenedentes bacterium]|nr:ComF family protein [Candidatus Hydrogenedentota bacterium]
MRECNISAAAREWTLTLKNLTFPIFCQQCGIRLLTDDNGYFCPTCWESSPRIERPFCPICGKPHRAGVGLGTRSNFRCGPCSTQNKPYPYDRVLAAARYDAAIQLAIKRLKFNDKPRIARPLGELLREQVERELDCDAYDFIVPVPLHRVRRRARGFNQAELLAQEISPIFPNAVIDTTLIRFRPTQVQSKLHSEKHRRESVRGAFGLGKGANFDKKKVLLIDDVVTTGATIHECATVLKKGGAAVVDVLAVALAIPGSDADVADLGRKE